MQLKIETREQEVILLHGEVRWSKKYASLYAHKLISGMGVLISDFKKGKDIYESFCPREVCINCTPSPEDHLNKTDS
jgi:hypothetical protein